MVDRERQSLEIYRLHSGELQLAEKVAGDDNLMTPVLPGFSCLAKQVFILPPLSNP